MPVLSGCILHLNKRAAEKERNCWLWPQSSKADTTLEIPGSDGLSPHCLVLESFPLWHQGESGRSPLRPPLATLDQRTLARPALTLQGRRKAGCCLQARWWDLGSLSVFLNRKRLWPNLSSAASHPESICAAVLVLFLKLAWMPYGALRS